MQTLTARQKCWTLLHCDKYVQSFYCETDMFLQSDNNFTVWYTCSKFLQCDKHDLSFYSVRDLFKVLQSNNYFLKVSTKFLWKMPTIVMMNFYHLLIINHWNWFVLKIIFCFYILKPYLKDSCSDGDTKYRACACTVECLERSINTITNIIQ